LPTVLNSNDTRAYPPKDSVRWLGIILDPKLMFDQHIKHLTKHGTAAANCLGMLANAIGGLKDMSRHCTQCAYSWHSCMHHQYGGQGRKDMSDS
jgi:hypothetical protein